MHRELPQIMTERLLLRIGSAADVPAIVAFYQANAAFLAPFSPRWPEQLFTPEYWNWQVAEHEAEFQQDRSCKLFIFPADAPERVIGNVNFSNIVRGAAQYCTVGYSLAEAVQGQGLMREALAAALGYAFDELRLHRVMANYMPRNERSGRVLRSLGFTVEGYARDYLRINGQWEDHLLTSLINPRWQPQP